jgi:hypothetical protein
VLNSKLTFEERARAINTYLPYQLKVLLPSGLTGIVEELNYLNFERPARLRVIIGDSLVGDIDSEWVHPSVEEVTPLLYSLADVPRLVGTNGWRPVEGLLNKMHFIATEDRGAGEYVNRVDVLSASDTELRLSVGTGYNAPDNSYHDETDTLIEDEPNGEYQKGCDYEVIISAFGTIDWRNVTADGIESTNPGGRPVWQPLAGAWVLSAFEYLAQLHVAVGKLARAERRWNPGANAHDELPLFARKQLPAQEEVSNG